MVKGGDCGLGANAFTDFAVVLNLVLGCNRQPRGLRFGVFPVELCYLLIDVCDESFPEFLFVFVELQPDIVDFAHRDGFYLEHFVVVAFLCEVFAGRQKAVLGLVYPVKRRKPLALAHGVDHGRDAGRLCPGEGLCKLAVLVCGLFLECLDLLWCIFIADLVVISLVVVDLVVIDLIFVNLDVTDLVFVGLVFVGLAVDFCVDALVALVEFLPFWGDVCGCSGS